jgi:hypothetical protein
MPLYSPAEAAKPYLDSLEKEMTLMGVWAVFCVLAAAAVFDRVLGSKQADGSDLIISLQHTSFVYLLGAIAALLIAASLFEFQRHDLSWLNGQISYAVTCIMSKVKIPDDTSQLDEAILLGNTWSIWNRYKFGMTFLATAVVEVGIALCHAIPSMKPAPAQTAVFNWQVLWCPVTIAFVPFLLATCVCVCIYRVMGWRDAKRS